MPVAVEHDIADHQYRGEDVAALIGPAVGGTFAQIDFWRGAFWINAPIIVGFMLAAWFRLPERRSPPPLSMFPWRRMALLSLGVLCVGVASNWQSLIVQGALIAASVLLVWQTLRLDAAGPSKLFPSHPFSPKTTTGSASWVFFLSSMTHTVIGVFLPLALQVLHGVDPLVAGYMTASLAVCWTFASMATAHLHGRAASAAIIVGQVMCCVGLGSLALFMEHVPTWVVPLLNGIDHVAALRARFGPRAIAATIRVSAERSAPGVIVETGMPVLVELASDHPAPRPRMAAFADVLRSAEIPARLGDSEAQVLWSKLVNLNAMSCATSAYDANAGGVRDHPRRRADLQDALDEGAAVAAAEGATVDVDAMLRFIWQLDPEHTTSMQRDVADGNPPELDAIPGAVLRHAAAHGLVCPTIERLVGMIEARC